MYLLQIKKLRAGERKKWVQSHKNKLEAVLGLELGLLKPSSML